MTKILILGGYGLTGRPLARHLLEQTDAEIILAGRHLEKARTYANQLNMEHAGGRVTAVYADAADRQSLEQALHGVDLLLVAAPTTQYAGVVIRLALDCGVDYLDVQLGENKLALLKSHAEEIKARGRCFITEAGFHPGLPAALVRHAATRLDRIESAITACYLNMGQALPYTEAVDELIEVFKNYQAQVFKNGRWTKPGSYDLRKINFGGEIGARQCFSMYFEELHALPEMFPGLKDAGFYISSTNWLLDWVISPVLLLGLKIAPQRGVRPLGKLYWWGMQNLPKPPYLILLKVEARGEVNGKKANLEIAVSHPDGYELTAVPVVACLLQYLDGTARRPGLWMMGHLVEPGRLFHNMQQMGIRVTCGELVIST